LWHPLHAIAPTTFTDLVQLRHNANADVFSATPRGKRLALGHVKLRPNFTSKTGFLRPENQAFFLRRLLVIRNKQNTRGRDTSSENSVKLKNRLLIEFEGWSLPLWPKSFSERDFLKTTIRVVYRFRLTRTRAGSISGEKCCCATTFLAFSAPAWRP
jgi:hypothetical protein